MTTKYSALGQIENHNDNSLLIFEVSIPIIIAK